MVGVICSVVMQQRQVTIEADSCTSLCTGTMFLRGTDAKMFDPTALATGSCQYSDTTKCSLAAIL